MSDDLMPCPLCRSPHVNIARDIKGDPHSVFCKVCGCQAPVAAWNRRAGPQWRPIAEAEAEQAVAYCLDAPAVYMGGPSPGAKRRAKSLLEKLRVDGYALARLPAPPTTEHSHD